MPSTSVFSSLSTEGPWKKQPVSLEFCREGKGWLKWRLTDLSGGAPGLPQPEDLPADRDLPPDARFGDLAPVVRSRAEHGLGVHDEHAVRGEAVDLLALGGLPLGRLLAQEDVPGRVEARRVDPALVLGGRAPPVPAAAVPAASIQALRWVGVCSVEEFAN